MLTQERLKEVLNYDPDTGLFTRKIITSNRIKIGDIAGTLVYGYIVINVNAKRHCAHRLAWLYVYGEFPCKFLDHKNGIRDDNRICNLREATNAENTHNSYKARPKNTTGLRGVSLCKNRYRSSITVLGKRVSLGVFGTPLEAHQAYLVAKKEFHPFAVTD